MVNAFKGTEPRLFEQPANIIRLKIDPESAQAARSGCPVSREEFFIKGTEPMEACALHAGGVKGLFQKWFKRD
jgi:penicillin-binding protein 2D